MNHAGCNLQRLESDEEAQKSKERVAAALLQYRIRQGLFIDPAEEAKWNGVYAAGTQLMQQGQLGAAVRRFEEVLEAVPARSKLGGEAQLQRAICLDSVACCCPILSIANLSTTTADLKLQLIKN